MKCLWQDKYICTEDLHTYTDFTVQYLNIATRSAVSSVEALRIILVKFLNHNRNSTNNNCTVFSRILLIFSRDRLLICTLSVTSTTSPTSMSNICSWVVDCMHFYEYARITAKLHNLLLNVFPAGLIYYPWEFRTCSLLLHI